MLRPAPLLTWTKDDLLGFAYSIAIDHKVEGGSGDPSCLVLHPSGATHPAIKLDPHAEPVTLQRIPTLTQTDNDHDLKRDVATLTDLCGSSDLAEVEIVSLVEEQIPRYRLRADTLTQFTGYENEDWFIPHPVLSPETDTDYDLSPELTRETLEYFELQKKDPQGRIDHVQSGSRVSQMTRTYNDIDAVTRLLEEKEKDLELAARIGQKLLQKNQTLEQRNETLDEEVTNSRDQITQLKHELTRKTELLHIYQNHDNDGSESDSNDGHPMDFLQRKIRVLEDENFHLAQKTKQVSWETENLEDKELQLINEFTNQISDLNLENARLSEELSTKIDECNKQQEDITYLLAQVADLQAKYKQYRMENEDLHTHLQAAKECQNDLTAELADFKEKYEEVVELLHDTQEQLRNFRKKGFPSVSRRGMYSPYVNPDSLASELESSISSDSGSFNPNSRQLHNLRVFETVRCAKQNASSTSTNPAHLKHLYSMPTVHASNTAGGSICSVPDFSAAPSVQSRFPSLAMSSPSISSPRPAYANLDRGTVSDSEGSTFTDGGSEDGSYSSLSSLGRPGVPGSNDLETALRRLSLRRQSEAEYLSSVRQTFDDGHTPNQCRTPDSIMSTGSGLSGLSGLTGVSGYAMRHYHFPEKLQIVKPMEGSVTLLQWQQLATPHLGGIFEERPGVQIKGERKLEEIDEVYTLTDLEEDDELSHPGKLFDCTSTINTYTNSTVLHPDDVTRVTPSGMTSSQMSAMMTSVGPPSSCFSSCLNSPQGRERATSTFSTTLSLAKVLHERGIVPSDAESAASELESVRDKGEEASPPPATPCNSPEGSPPSTPLPFPPLKMPSLVGLGSALSRGAELLGVRQRRPSKRSESQRTRDTTSSAQTMSEGPESTSVPCSLANMNLVEKVNRLDLSKVVPPSSSSSGALPAYTLPTYHHLKPTSPMAQLTSLRSLSFARTPTVTIASATTTVLASTSKPPPTRASAPPTSLSLPQATLGGNIAASLELGTIGTLASFRKGGLS